MTITRTYTFKVPNLEYFRDELNWKIETEEDLVKAFKDLTFDDMLEVCNAYFIKTEKI